MPISFFGAVPVTRPLTEGEVAADYEGNTGRVVVERFADLDPTGDAGGAGGGARAVYLGTRRGRGGPKRHRPGSRRRDGHRNLVDRPPSAPLESYIVEKHSSPQARASAYYGQQIGRHGSSPGTNRVDMEPKSLEAWFVTGSQHLYGEAALRQVAENSRRVVEGLNASSRLPIRVVPNRS